MEIRQKVVSLGLMIASCGILFFLAGCGTVRETLPDQSAMEQLLISTAADRAAYEIPTGQLADKRIFIDNSNLECYAKAYVTQLVEDIALDSGGILAAKQDDADLVLKLSSGALSINKRDHLIGIPAIPVPVPGAEPLSLPEVPLFKKLRYQGKAKFRVTAIDPSSQKQPFDIPLCYGKSKNTFWWFFLMGPFETSNLPKGIR